MSIDGSETISSLTTGDSLLNTVSQSQPFNSVLIFDVDYLDLVELCFLRSADFPLWRRLQSDSYHIYYILILNYHWLHWSFSDIDTLCFYVTGFWPILSALDDIFPSHPSIFQQFYFAWYLVHFLCPFRFSLRLFSTFYPFCRTSFVSI